MKEIRQAHTAEDLLGLKWLADAADAIRHLTVPFVHKLVASVPLGVGRHVVVPIQAVEHVVGGLAADPGLEERNGLDCSSSEQFVPDPFQREAPDVVIDGPSCSCGVPSMALPSYGDTGRPFYKCPRPHGEQCSFFQWFDEGSDEADDMDG